VGRKAILEVHIKGKPLADDVDLSVLARRTPGFTGADLANMLNEAALLAARYNKNLIGMEEMEQAVERVIAGPEKKSKVISDAEKKLVSYHEAGHAVVAYYVPNSDPLHKISIIPRGRAGGYTLLLPQEDTHYDTKSKMMDQIAIFLGGRMAEILVLKEISTGASNDLERATDMVRQMITRYGMSDDLGPLTFGKAQTQVFLGRDISQERNYSEAIAFAIDKEARRMMDEAYHRAQTILSEHMDKLEKVAQTLMEKETIEAAEFYAIMEDKEYTEPIDINPVEPKAEAVSEAVPANTNGEATSLKVTYNGENTKTEIRKNPEIKSSSEDDPMNRWLK
jgi:cell division protease FtsH